ncbi:peptidase M28 [Halobiforma lacisalsi AJ5]|uniref:Carboxypeptidase Q n=1 Tax=Natronobacterium lacisalsi AJ5 TaxID=358396 RepID=M0LLB6_NATLA|nr:M28 family metallopeptidase [Halobiforma lacisalsi]APW98464.1 peptidase M28 [Halobiforma lacisalsi AJ5]EMA33239.1 peptidase M28 [Halobiforma lacisalsi AJ5]
MTKLPDSVVGDAHTSSFHWDVLEDLVDIGNRMAGQEGERRGAERVKAAFEEVGLRNVALEEFEIDGWWRGNAVLETARSHAETYDADYQVIGLPGTPSGTVEAELVDVGYGRLEDFADADLEGNVAMASSETPADHDRRLHRMEKYASAVDAGAVGFVFRNHVEGCLPATGEIGYDNRPGPIPAVGVSREVGRRLLRHAEDGELTVELGVDARNEPTDSVNVVGEVGPDTDEVVLVTSHVDAHDIAEGANDNGAGTALVCEIARLLKRVEDDLETRVRFVPFGSEEIGLQGASHAAATLDLENVKCVINLDGAGNSRTLRVNANEFDAVATLFEEVADEYDVPLETDDTISPHGDQWAFVQEGVPASMTSSSSDSSGRGWGHTHADTLDKLDVRDLRELSVLVASAAFTAAEADREFPQRSREETKALLDEGYVQELKIGGRWPYDETGDE